MSFDHVMAAVQGIETKIADYATRTEQRTRELADEILQIRQRGAVLPLDNPNRGGVNLGASVEAQFRKNIEIYEKQRSLAFKVPLSMKALVSLSNVQSHQQVEGLAYSPRPTDTMLIGALQNRPLQGVSTAHYSRYTSNSGNIGVQAGEGAAKAEISPDFSPVAQNAITIAGWCPITEQALRTAGELESVVNTFLADQVMIGIDGVLVGGTAEPEWPFAGLKDLATAYPSAYTGMADTIAECVAVMRAYGLRPDVVVLNPMEFLGLVLAKNLQGDYLSGSYLADQPLVVHGCRVVFSAGIDEGEALILDSRHIELGFSQDLNVQIGFSGDDFKVNKRTIRGEAAIIPIFRHSGAARLATPAAP